MKGQSMQQCYWVCRDARKPRKSACKKHAQLHIHTRNHEFVMLDHNCNRDYVPRLVLLLAKKNPTKITISRK